MSSKLRLNGKGTRGTARLSEKEQIDLAIKLSLQQQGREHSTTGQHAESVDGPPVNGSIDHTVTPTGANAPIVDEPRKRRASAVRRSYAPEESDDESSAGLSDASQQGGDDYKPNLSDSDIEESDDESDFAGEESDDEGPRKKRRSEVAKSKKPAAKVAAARNKTTAGTKAAATLSGKPPSSSRTTGDPSALGLKVDTVPSATAAAGSVLTQPARAIRAPISQPLAPSRRAPCTAALGDAGKHLKSTDASCDGGNDCDPAHEGTAPPDLDAVPLAADARPPSTRQTDEAGCSSNQHPCDTSVPPKLVGPNAKPAAAAPKAVSAKALPPGKSTYAKGIAKLTTSASKQASKPLAAANRSTPGVTFASAPLKPLTGASGGAYGIKTSAVLLAGAVPYRVPGLRRPGGSSAVKKSSSETS